jgi:hypothetical protein
MAYTENKSHIKTTMTASSSSVNNTFVHQMQRLMEWIDSDAQHLSKDEILDGVRVRMLVMVKKFIAFPHCHNFSLMQQPVID